MSTVFISSVIKNFEAYRLAASEAVVLMGHQPIMGENLPAQPHSSDKVCLTEVEQCDVYLLVLGPRYGYETASGRSVTHEEYLAARNSNKPVLVFVQHCEMEPAQQRFREDVEEYHDGHFRGSFETPQQLKDEIIRSLRALEQQRNAIESKEFESHLNHALTLLANFCGRDIELILSFLPQPTKFVDLRSIEESSDGQFQLLADHALVRMRDGYDEFSGESFTGLKSGNLRYALFDDGLRVLIADPRIVNESAFSYAFASPSRIKTFAIGFGRLIEDNGGFCHLRLNNMSHAAVAEPPSGNSVSLPFHGDEKSPVYRTFYSFHPGEIRDMVGSMRFAFTKKIPRDWTVK